MEWVTQNGVLLVLHHCATQDAYTAVGANLVQVHTLLACGKVSAIVLGERQVKQMEKGGATERDREKSEHIGTQAAMFPNGYFTEVTPPFTVLSKTRPNHHIRPTTTICTYVFCVSFLV